MSKIAGKFIDLGETHNNSRIPNIGTTNLESHTG